jgi:SAM-dependent methyltransferase
MRLYADLVPWYRMFTPPADYAGEAASYRAAFERAVTPPAETLLELGAGAGHNAFHLKQRFRCTLTDVSDAMLSLSRALNPECEHLLGDMRTLHLGRQFDAVLVHDAVMYMLSEADLAAAIATAFSHTRPGGAALFAPDATRETFRDETDFMTGQEGDRALRAIEWSWDPDPTDTTTTVEYAFLLREGRRVTAVHDRHVEGLFPRAVWVKLLTDAGFSVEMVSRPLDDEGEYDEVFLARRPPGDD